MSFINIKDSIYLSFYIQEIWSISTCINSLKNRLDSLKIIHEIQSKPSNNILSNGHEPHEIISSILNHTARLNKLFQATSKRDGETSEDFDFRKNRSKLLRKLLLPKKKAGHEILKSSVRNAVEHFDERLDTIISRIIEQEKEINEKTIVYNMTLSSESVFSHWDRTLPIKVFVVKGSKYYMLDANLNKQSIELNEVFSENVHIMKKCEEWINNHPDKDGKTASSPCGLIKVAPHLLNKISK